MEQCRVGSCSISSCYWREPQGTEMRLRLNLRVVSVDSWHKFLTFQCMHVQNYMCVHVCVHTCMLSCWPSDAAHPRLHSCVRIYTHACLLTSLAYTSKAAFLTFGRFPADLECDNDLNKRVLPADTARAYMCWTHLCADAWLFINIVMHRLVTDPACVSRIDYQRHFIIQKHLHVRLECKHIS